MAVVYFYSATSRRYRAAMWSIFSPALIKFSSSRIFPGQSHAVRLFITAVGTASIFFCICLANFWTKYLTSSGMSSLRSLTVDGTLIQAWASQKSFRSKDGSDDDDGTDFRGQKRSNDTHQSTTDPDARLYKKSYGKESKLSYLGHALVENRNGLIAAAMVTHADGYAERDAALLMLAERQQGRARRITVGADKAYDSEDFVRTVRELNVTPHITKNDKNRSSNLDRRTTRQPGYAISLSRRWLIEKGEAESG